jgi:hypothetical protein
MRSIRRPENLIGTIKIVLHCRDELMCLPKSEAADTVVGEVAKFTLQHLQPGPRNRDEVEMETRILPKTGLHAKFLSAQ